MKQTETSEKDQIKAPPKGAKPTWQKITKPEQVENRNAGPRVWEKNTIASKLEGAQNKSLSNSGPPVPMEHASQPTVTTSNQGIDREHEHEGIPQAPLVNQEIPQTNTGALVVPSERQNLNFYQAEDELREVVMGPNHAWDGNLPQQIDGGGIAY